VAGGLAAPVHRRRRARPHRHPRPYASEEGDGTRAGEARARQAVRVHRAAPAGRGAPRDTASRCVPRKVAELLSKRENLSHTLEGLTLGGVDEVLRCFEGRCLERVSAPRRVGGQGLHARRDLPMRSIDTPLKFTSGVIGPAEEPGGALQALDLA